jgi:ABC-2 type transport system permease protein
MKMFLFCSFTVARRDFMAIVATPSFLLFLLAPLFFLGLGLFSSMGSSSLIEAERNKDSLLVVLPADELALVQRVDAVLRTNLPSDAGPMRVDYRPVTSTINAEALFNEREANRRAMLVGRLSAPEILERRADSSSGNYLRLIARQAALEQQAGSITAPVSRVVPLPPTTVTAQKDNPAKMIAMLSIVAIFMLTLLIVSQATSGIAEEKANKVIEILAAAVPLESVFLGKLLAMIGVGVIFVGFWGGLASVGSAAFAVTQVMGDQGVLVDQALVSNLAPAVGWSSYIILTVIYTICTFLLYGSLFLGMGGLASSPREVQMLSFPLVVLQMIAFMMAASSVVGGMEGTLGIAAQIIPFTASYAMLGRAAVDGNLWVHAAAIAWQILWITIMINLSVRLFRRGVLGDGDWKFWRKSKA